MKFSVFDQTPNDATKESMFLGQSINLQRYDQSKYQVYNELSEKQKSFFWRPEEIDLSKDRIDFESLPEHEKHIFLRNLDYQSLLDSVQGRSPAIAFLPLISIPELEHWTLWWTSFECLAEGTEVLTTNGWKDLKDVTLEDKVAQYDLYTEKVQFVHPLAKIEKYKEGTMYHYIAKNPKQFNQLVTPGHRMPVIKRTGYYDTSKRWFEEARNHKYETYHLAPVSGYLESSDASALSDLDKLRIATQADGTVSKRYTGVRSGTVPVWFTFSKRRKIERLYSICENLNFNIRELTPDKHTTEKVKQKRRFKVDVPAEYDVLSWKTLNWVDLEKVDYNWCEDFLIELGHWDGTFIRNARGVNIVYSSIIKENVDTVQSVAAVCGYSARYKLQKDNRKDTYNDMHTVCIFNSRYKDGQSIEKHAVKYKGMVRCLTVPSGAFLIRYKGVVSVSGNCIHSYSYTYIMRNVLTDPSEEFDSIVVNEEIKKRADAITGYYDDLIEYSQYYNLLGEGEFKISKRIDGMVYDAFKTVTISKRELMKKLYLCMFVVNVLEAIRFYASFAASFSFAERKLMEGNAKIIKLIARDEALHLTTTQHIINTLASGAEGNEWKEIAEETKEECINIFREAAQQEKDWARYLFKDGSMIGLNETILCQYIDYITNHRMKAVGLEPIFPNANSNPIPWINTWLTSDNVQVAPQEVEISSYLVGQVDSALDSDDLADIEL